MHKTLNELKIRPDTTTGFHGNRYGLVKIRCPYDLALREKNKVFKKLLKYLEFCSSTL